MDDADDEGYCGGSGGSLPDLPQRSNLVLIKALREIELGFAWLDHGLYQKLLAESCLETCQHLTHASTINLLTLTPILIYL